MREAIAEILLSRIVAEEKSGFARLHQIPSSDRFHFLDYYNSIPENERVALHEAHALMRHVVIYPGEDGQWVAECPSLPGCISQGRTKDEAIANIRDAVATFIETLLEDKLPVPPEKFETYVVAV